LGFSGILPHLQNSFHFFWTSRSSNPTYPVLSEDRKDPIQIYQDLRYESVLLFHVNCTFFGLKLCARTDLIESLILATIGVCIGVTDLHLHTIELSFLWVFLWWLHPMIWSLVYLFPNDIFWFSIYTSRTYLLASIIHWIYEYPTIFLILLCTSSACYSSQK